MHQDTAYVVTDHSVAITASWIALEDIQPGSGELVYYRGSHRDINAVFENGKKIWNRNADDMETNKDYQKNLALQCEQAGLVKESFRARKGEILLWHSGLVHGGEVIANRDLTRRSLVTHYCPASGKPNYFNIQKEIACKRTFAGGMYSTRHYDIRPESSNPYPVFTGGKDIAAEKGFSYDDD
jgi:phytanoyl-CoA hydroxylase